jgi:hypothetical protein
LDTSALLFHAAIHGLIELSIFNNITMLELRTTVKEWLTTAAQPESEGVIERWAIQRQAASTHTGTTVSRRNDLLKSKSNGETIARLWCIARYCTHPSTAPKSLNLVLFDVQSDIHSENWSHYCPTRPIEPTEGAELEEPYKK